MSTTNTTVELSSLYNSTDHEKMDGKEENVDHTETTTDTPTSDSSDDTSTDGSVPITDKEEEEDKKKEEDTNNTPEEETKEEEDTKPKEEEDSDSDSDSSSDDEVRPMPRFRSSIKLKTLLADIPVKIKRGSFRTLPKPDMDKVRKAATLPAYMNPEDVFRAMSGTNCEEDRTNLNVKFDKVDIRNYDQTIGDNPSVSYGPPIALDWKYEQQQAVTVEDFEQLRDGKRRPFKKLGLNYYQRKGVLEQQGYTESDIKQAKKQASKDKFKRAVTKYFLPASLLEDAAESTVRKMKRGVAKRRQSLS